MERGGGSIVHTFNEMQIEDKYEHKKEVYLI